MIPDGELLRRYSETHSESAFTELVERHLALVYSAALRQVNGDAHLAQDVAQTVFADLAGKATSLAGRSVLTGWLYTSALFAAAKAVRTERRRHTREQEAHLMNQLLCDAAPDLDWEKLRPVLDAAMLELNNTDQEAVLLRYFDNRPHAEIADRLGLSENAARMRVERALEKLHALISRRGVSTTAALSAVISAHAVQVAPAGLAATLSTAALAGKTLTAATTATAIKTVAMTTLQKTLITATIVAAVGTGIYEARRASTLQAQLQTFQQQQALLDGQLQKLREEKDDSANRSTSLADKPGGPGSSSGLLKLRAEVTRLRNEANDAIAAGKEAMDFQAQVLQVLSNTPPVRTLVANSTASVPWNDTAVLGGWKAPSGKRAIIMANVARGDDATQITITSRILEYAEAAGENLGLSKFNTDESLPTRPNILTAERASELLKLAQGSGEVELVNSLRITTRSGGQAQIRSEETHSTPSGQQYSTGPVVDVFPTVSPDGQSVQLVKTAQLNYLIPILPH